MKILFVILLIYLCRNQIIWQSNTSTVIKGVGQAVQNLYPYNKKIPQALSAIWIWSQGYKSPKCQNKITIQKNLVVQYSNPIAVFMTADNNFTLQIDGNQILKGDDFTKIYYKNLTLNCGKNHTLKITAFNIGPCSSLNPGGLIFAFLQKNIYNKCPPIPVIKKNPKNLKNPKKSSSHSTRYNHFSLLSSLLQDVSSKATSRF